MIKSRLAAVVFAFGMLLSTVSAQYGSGYSDSVNYFTTSVSDPSVSVNYVGDGPYTNGVPATETGDTLNIAYNRGITDFYTKAQNDSYDVDAPYNGHASQFVGFYFFIDFTNTSDVDQTFGVAETLYEQAEVEGNATSVSYGGFEEYGGADEVGFNTMVLDSNGTAYDDPVNYNNYFYDGDSADSGGGFTDTLMPDDTIEVQVWASGFTSVNSSAAVPSLSGEYQPAASSTPSPAAALPFLLGVFARRRRKA